MAARDMVWEQYSSILVVAAHPDDEVLGCAGALFRHRLYGARVHVLFLADGELARRTSDETFVGRRLAMAEAAAHAMGGLSTRMAGFPDNRLDAVDMLDLARTVETEIAQHNPDLIYTHHPGDLNIDHRRAHQAVMTACRPIEGLGVREIRCFEVLSSTEWAGPGLGPPFEPTLFIGLDDEAFAAKRSAFNAYAAEMREAPHPRSWEAVSALATLRGAAAGMPRAEAFFVSRRLVL